MSNSRYDDFPITALDEIINNEQLSPDELLFEKVKHYSMCLFGLAVDLRELYVKYLEADKVINGWKARSDYYYKQWKREIQHKKKWYDKYKELKALLENQPK